MATPSAEAEELKAEGNRLYQRGKYAAAIDAYTLAVTAAPRWISPYVNRALCHRKLKRWEGVRDDCVKALEIDRENIKANYMLGLSLIFEKKHTEAATKLSKALENARASDATMQDEIWRELARAKYLEWELHAAARATRYQNAERKLRAACGVAGTATTSGGGGGGGGGADYMDLTMEDADPFEAAWRDAKGAGGSRSGSERPSGSAPATPMADQLTRDDWPVVEELLAAARGRDDRREDPPDCFCCKLTFEVFRDPVVAPSGHSYERIAITTHLEKVGAFDPITREPLYANDLRPNISLRNAAHEWLNHHAWAYADIIKPDAPLE